MPNEYDIGDRPRVSVTFTSASTPTDPSVVKCFILKPDGTALSGTPYIYSTDAELVKDDTGDYHVDIDLTESGTWTYRWEGINADASFFDAEEATLLATDSGFYP